MSHKKPSINIKYPMSGQIHLANLMKDIRLAIGIEQVRDIQDIPRDTTHGRIPRAYEPTVLLEQTNLYTSFENGTYIENRTALDDTFLDKTYDGFSLASIDYMQRHNLM